MHQKRSQTGVKSYVIIINNCSTDRTLGCAACAARIHAFGSQQQAVRRRHRESQHRVQPDVRTPDTRRWCLATTHFPDTSSSSPCQAIIGQDCRGLQLSGSIIKWQGFQMPTTVFRRHRRHFLLRRSICREEPVSYLEPTLLVSGEDIVGKTKSLPKPLTAFGHRRVSVVFGTQTSGSYIRC